MKLSSNEMSMEARWGSYYSNSGIGLYAEHRSWPEGYSARYLSKQFEYERERLVISGARAIVHSWQWAEPHGVYKYEAELRIYDEQLKMLVKMVAACKERTDVKIAKQIFNTVVLP